MSEERPTAKYFFEVSFEVCNKVGGIYQVISTKAEEMKRYYGDGYITIGYFRHGKPNPEFIPKDPGELRSIFEEVESSGVKCYYGTWDINGKPDAILVDARGINVNEVKKRLWEWYGIDSLSAPPDFDEPVAWSYGAAILLKRLMDFFKGEKVFQFHEWLSGPALLKLKKEGVNKGLVFTTHATFMGRVLSSRGVDLSEEISKLKSEGRILGDDVVESYREAKAKHQVEKMAALEANVFTTVSDSTAEEAEFILGRKPEVILYNGIDMKNFPSDEDLAYQHKVYKKRIIEFLTAYFSPYYKIEFGRDPRIIFISGRYEFHNKGIDVFIDALGRLNKKLKKNIFVFFFIPSDTKGENLEVLRNKNLLEEIKEFAENISQEVREMLIECMVKGESTENVERWVEKYRKDIRSFSLQFRKGGNPPLSAFDLKYEHDAIIQRLVENGLENKESDRVKVVVYPTYVSKTDKLLSLDYYSVIRGCSAGVFPSYYEPWGYTPQEAAANRCVAVTTDCSGFGRFIMKSIGSKKEGGIYILHRKGRKYEDVVEELERVIARIVNLSPEEISAEKHLARRLVMLTSWKNFARNYIAAHNLSLK